jgi:hypothetical protein
MSVSLISMGVICDLCTALLAKCWVVRTE